MLNWGFGISRSESKPPSSDLVTQPLTCGFLVWLLPTGSPLIRRLRYQLVPSGDAQGDPGSIAWPTMKDPLLSIEDLAAYLQVPIQTVYNWRTEGRGPRAIKIGKHVRFRQTDVEAWLNSHREDPH